MNPQEDAVLVHPGCHTITPCGFRLVLPPVLACQPCVLGILPLLSQSPLRPEEDHFNFSG
jgi:hypothetical protein